MGVYNMTHYITYNSDTNALVNSGPYVATVNDLEGDTTFESGDTMIFDTQHYSYAGQVLVDGKLYPALNFHGNDPNTHDGFIMVIMDTAPVSVPPTLVLASTAPITVCFTTGSEISTQDGCTLVEDLAIDDLILTASGEAIPVKWIGRQTVSTRFGPAERLRPVRFAAGSLGDDRPHSDLTVTADHAMLVEGVLCNASALVNGTTITRVPLSEMGESYTVYHIETEAHEIILANGAETETYIDHTSRKVFDNYAEYEALFGGEPEMQELPLPRATTARQVPDTMRARLAAKSVA